MTGITLLLGAIAMIGSTTAQAELLDQRRPSATKKRAAKKVRSSAPRAALSSGPVYYRNCSAARAAGAAPVRAGDPGYSRKLDRDGDGIGCE